MDVNSCQDEAWQTGQAQGGRLLRHRLVAWQLPSFPSWRCHKREINRSRSRTSKYLWYLIAWRINAWLENTQAWHELDDVDAPSIQYLKLTVPQTNEALAELVHFTLSGCVFNWHMLSLSWCPELVSIINSNLHQTSYCTIETTWLQTVLYENLSCPWPLGTT